MNLVVIFSGYRTGGTAFLQAFRYLGFSIVHDPFSPWLVDKDNRNTVATDIMHHPPGTTYFEWFSNSLSLPGFMVGSEKPPEIEEKQLQVESYLRKILALKKWPEVDVAIKVEQLGLYPFLLKALPEATFLGLTRSQHAQRASFERLWLAGVPAFYNEALRNLRECHNRPKMLDLFTPASLKYRIVRAQLFRIYWLESRAFLRKSGVIELDVSPEGDFSGNLQALQRLEETVRWPILRALRFARSQLEEGNVRP